MHSFVLHLLTHQLSSAPLSMLPRVDRLEHAGLILTVSMMVSIDIPEHPEPLEDLAPGTIPEDFAETANLLRHRWDGRRRAEKFALARRKAVKRHGGHAGKIRAVDADHDLLLARVFCSLSERERRRWRPSAWLEDHDISFGGWLPDAAILGRTLTLIEIGGSSYSKEKLERRAEAARGFRRLLY